MYKAFTAAIAELMTKHLNENQGLPPEQKALKRGTDGCLDAHLLDQMLTEDAILNQRELSMAWLDI